jgi:hypothetical protein
MKTPMQPDPRDYEIRIWYSAEKGDECFIAQVVEWSDWGERHGRLSREGSGRALREPAEIQWPGIMAHGDTREEAARQIQLALEGALEVAAEQGIKPPAPALAHAS